MFLVLDFLNDRSKAVFRLWDLCSWRFRLRVVPTNENIDHFGTRRYVSNHFFLLFLK